jgi:cardiolipin synthase A/B
MIRHRPIEGSGSGRVRALSPLVVLLLCGICMIGCDVTITPDTGISSTVSASCQGNCGVRGVGVFVEPAAGEEPILSAIAGAKKSVWLEMYLLTDTNVIRALQDAAQRGIDVRVMLEHHPGGISPARTMSELKAAGARVEYADPEFALTHEKGMLIDGASAYIMTSNFSRSALGGYGGGRDANREYAILDTNQQDAQAVSAIFQADWNRQAVRLDDSNLVVSPVNARSDFTALINDARQTLFVEAEEMNDVGIEQALSAAEHRGVRVRVVLPAPGSSVGESNSAGINTLRQGGVAVRTDSHLYMHAKIIVVDGREAFVGSENISRQSLDQNRELGIIVSDKGVLQTLQQTFQQDWGASQ